MTTLEILRAARALIAQPGRWCQGELARNAYGTRESPLTAAARQFCAVGALVKIRDRHHVSDLVEELRMDIPDREFVSTINDTTDLPTVLAMFDATIARMESQNVG